LLRSPAVTGLTKTYTANDFRVLRQTPSARQNTSRLPSTHVDVRFRLVFIFAVPLLTTFFFYIVGVSVDDDLACHGAHAASGAPFKSVWNGPRAAFRFLSGDMALL
jgi:hypothetical protein